MNKLVKRIQELRRSNAASYKDSRPKKERTRRQIKMKAVKRSIKENEE